MRDMGDRTDFINFRIRTSIDGATELNALGCLRLRSSERGKSLSLAKAVRHPEPPTLHGPVQMPEAAPLLC